MVARLAFASSLQFLLTLVAIELGLLEPPEKLWIIAGSERTRFRLWSGNTSHAVTAAAEAEYLLQYGYDKDDEQQQGEPTYVVASLLDLPARMRDESHSIYEGYRTTCGTVYRVR